MNDITALMGKLKANIAYLQFDEAGAQERAPWPVLQRLTRAQDGEAAPDFLPEVKTPAAPAAPAPATERSLLKRYAPPESVAAGVPADSRTLADIFARLARKPR